MKANPDNTEWQYSLASSYSKLAMARRANNQSSESREALVAGRAIMARLVKQYPDWLQFKSQLTWFDEQLAAME
jgi:hypothetical protein